MLPFGYLEQKYMLIILFIIGKAIVMQKNLQYKEEEEQKERRKRRWSTFLSENVRL